MKVSAILAALKEAQRKGNVMEVILATIMIILGVVIVGTTYNSVNTTGLPNASAAANTLSASTTAFQFLALGLIVAGAMWVVSIIQRSMGGGQR